MIPVKKTAILLLIFFQHQFAFAQHIDIVLKGGHLIDPKNGIDKIADVAILNGRISKIAKNISARYSTQVIDARGMLVVPGLVDIHTHVFFGTDPERHYCNGTKSLRPDGFTFCNGVTTIVDAGSSGWKDFPDFKKKIIDSSQTRVFAFLNVVGAGMSGSAHEQDTTDMDGNKTAMMARSYREYVVGVKIAHYQGPGWKPVNEAIRAGGLANIPVMIDFGENPSPLSLRELFTNYMRPGDIFTHCFAQLKGRQSIVDTSTGKLKSFVWEAKKKGIRFDVGYGEISFSFSQAIPAIDAGFIPNSVSTDMHASDKSKMKNILDILSEFLALGMNIPELISAVTWNPAREIRHEELGNMSVGSIADITLLKVYTGSFVFNDHTGYKKEGTKKIACVMTIKGGKIVYRRKGSVKCILNQPDSQKRLATK